MPSRSSSYESKASTASSKSARSQGSQYTAVTDITACSGNRPVFTHYDTCPDRFSHFVEEPLTDEGYDDRRASVVTYASSLSSAEDLTGQQNYEVPDERHECYDTDAIPSTASDFANHFPSTKRILIQHDDSTSDGNMNLRLDVEFTSAHGRKGKMTLFHLRMKDLYDRQFSLRRYCRESGREICSSKRKYIRPVPKSVAARRPLLQRSLTSALQNMGLNNLRNRKRADSGYESGNESDDEDDLTYITSKNNGQPTTPTNIIKLEFSNYAQVEVHRNRQGHSKRYDFEYWGEKYKWQREISVDNNEVIYSYELVNLRSGKCVAYIMPDLLNSHQAAQEKAQGGWIPPSSLRITSSPISDDLGDVIVATGLIALADDSIKRRWHNPRTLRVHVPNESNIDQVPPEQIMDTVFPRRCYTKDGR